VPWQEVSTVQLREEFIALAEQDGANVRQLCKRYGISPSTAYKWLGRHRKGEALSDRSRRPHASPERSEEALERAILAVRDAHPAWGARKIKHRLEGAGHAMPAASTVHAILARHGRISVPTDATRSTYQRFEHLAPNDLWQMDFKGHFALRSGRCHPLTILDDHSRYSLCLAACVEQSRQTVQAHLTATFRRYGVPWRMTMDNGPPWGSHGRTYTRLDVWLMKQGVRVGHSRPYHPQTQGKDERFHRTLQVELLQGRTFEDASATQRAFDHWRSVYNHQRPHEALAMHVPAQRYCAALREYQDRPPAPDYDDPQRVRRVQDGGLVTWKGHDYSVGTAFIGEPVIVRATTDERVMAVYWSSVLIARLNLTEHTSQFGRGLA